MAAARAEFCTWHEIFAAIIALLIEQLLMAAIRAEAGIRGDHHATI
jgi:hypothetical protein